MRTEEVRGQEDGRFSPSTSGVSSSQEVEKNKRATKHKLVRADLRRSGELAPTISLTLYPTPTPAPYRGVPLTLTLR